MPVKCFSVATSAANHSHEFSDRRSSHFHETSTRIQAERPLCVRPFVAKNITARRLSQPKFGFLSIGFFATAVLNHCAVRALSPPLRKSRWRAFCFSQTNFKVPYRKVAACGRHLVLKTSAGLKACGFDSWAFLFPISPFRERVNVGESNVMFSLLYIIHGMKKYSDEQIAEVVAIAKSFFHAQKLLTGSTSGSSYMHLKKRIISLELDVSHFEPYWNLKDASVKAGRITRFSASKILLKLPEGQRAKTHQVRRAMLEVGFEHKCLICGISEWLSNPIVLEIDHIDGDASNCIASNLRFLCPNCHSQTETYGYTGKR